jgi:hypothetical protein
MKTYTLEQLEGTLHDNIQLKLWKRNYQKVNILNTTQIDDNFIVIETDKCYFENCYFQTIDMENNSTIGIVSDSRDKQILITLWYKHDWPNSQFSRFATNMLWLK